MSGYNTGACIGGDGWPEVVIDVVTPDGLVDGTEVCDDAQSQTLCRFAGIRCGDVGAESCSCEFFALTSGLDVSHRFRLSDEALPFWRTSMRRRIVSF